MIKIPANITAWNRSLSDQQMEILSIPWVSLVRRGGVLCAGHTAKGDRCKNSASFHYEGPTFSQNVCGNHIYKIPEALGQGEQDRIERFERGAVAWKTYRTKMKEIFSQKK